MNLRTIHAGYLVETDVRGRRYFAIVTATRITNLSSDRRLVSLGETREG